MRAVVLFAAVLVAGLLAWFFWPDEPERTTRSEDERKESLGEAEKRAYWKGRAADEPDTPAEDPAKKTLAEVPLKPIRVRVLFEDGQPAAGADVELYGFHQALYGRPPKHRGTTDEQGVATMTVPFGRYWLRARRGSLASAPERIPALRGGERFQLLLSDSVAISGIVLLPDGRPKDGASVSINYWDGWEYRFVEGKSLPDGTFRSPPIPRRWIRKMHVWVTNTGLPRALFEYDRLVTDLRLQLSAERVRGTVRDETGRPRAKVMIRSRLGAVLTDKDGRFELWLQKRAGERLIIGTTVRLLEESDETIEVVLGPTKPLFGRLLTYDRQPREGTVRILSPTGVVIGRGHSTAGGRFRFENVALEPYTLAVVDLQLDRDVPVAEFRVADARPGPPLEIVLPKPIRVTLRFRTEDGSDTEPARDTTLIVRRAGREVIKANLVRMRTALQFVVWHEDDYRVLVTTAFHEPARLGPVRIDRTNRSFDMALKKRPHRR